jgi:DNA-binding GntR family transcriptional regulator
VYESERPAVTAEEEGEISGTANSWSLKSVARSSMPDEVLRELRDAIVEGRIAQGEQLREVQLAATLGTGRGVIREAVRQLVQEGLVEYLPHRGAFVHVMSLQDSLDVYVAREALESGAAREALQSGRPFDLVATSRALLRLRAAAEGHDRVTEAMIGADVDFHRELVALAASPRLTRAHDTLVAETRMLLRHHPVYPASDYVGDHTRLLEAFERRDPQTPDLVAEHLRLSARLIGSEIERENAQRNTVSARQRAES